MDNDKRKKKMGALVGKTVILLNRLSSISFYQSKYDLVSIPNY